MPNISTSNVGIRRGRVAPWAFWPCFPAQGSLENSTVYPHNLISIYWISRIGLPIASVQKFSSFPELARQFPVFQN